MKIQQFKCWWPAQEETEETANIIEALTFEGAAESHAEGVFLGRVSISHSDFPAIIFVRLPGGEIKVVKVGMHAEFLSEGEVAL